MADRGAVAPAPAHRRCSQYSPRSRWGSPAAPSTRSPPTSARVAPPAVARSPTTRSPSPSSPTPTVVCGRRGRCCANRSPKRTPSPSAAIAVDRPLRACIALACLHACDTAVAVTSIAHNLGGGDAAYVGSPLPRALRRRPDGASAPAVRPQASRRARQALAGLDVVVPPVPRLTRPRSIRRRSRSRPGRISDIRPPLDRTPRRIPRTCQPCSSPTPAARPAAPRSRRLRREDRIPGVVYGHGMEPLSVSVDRRELRAAVSGAAGLNTVLDLTVDSAVYPAIIKDLQRHPVRRTRPHRLPAGQPRRGDHRAGAAGLEGEATEVCRTTAWSTRPSTPSRSSPRRGTSLPSSSSTSAR